MTEKIVPVIIAGGKGKRLWPLSRAAAPKQFIRFVGSRTLFQNTLARVSNTAVYEPAIVVTNEEYRFLVAEQARELGSDLSSIVLEPVACNTAAAIAAAALEASVLFGKNAVMHVLPSDHEIDINETYVSAILTARAAAEDSALVTFGITPTEPATGYGYIEIGDILPSGARAVKRFVEKPALSVAIEMLSAGGVYWNSGMFMFAVPMLFSELEKFAPDVLDASKAAVAGAVRQHNFLRLDRQAFEKSPSISIDHAVMEKTSRAAVVPAVFKWSDLGSWDSVWKSGKRDKDENVASENTTLFGTRSSLVMSHGPHLVVSGLERIVAIATKDAVYVGRMEDSQGVSNVVERLEATPTTSKLTELHPTCYRPWGCYTSVHVGDGFHVRLLFVSPGMKLSPRKHQHRSERWVVVKGIAEITIGERVKILRENESAYIPVGEVHRLENPGKSMLELIEIQTDSYLGKLDTIGTADGFGRA
ncbi:mannose-1-phosphate guanylyltransferase/mannose-6-phosphate isomerase [Ensifer sp. LCM 4579]|uniref:mannose-1-phosphate guanylyltransferase/mannose-6-phosphate isomerase n=1 Tax=Ensifer sp. LCM 4579 TaxID=1848292 RepID=UPI0008DA5598|nr:mannose-1-phosphate guanylyltransferase/mannose-6-phosphate isomerase [Ensifer sp. LCM 4579]OHV79342.1 mannose-1-phosphate guanylyltransferase/mannose-6-phosphate isomerase [Ensifer sp. LCM 4579]